MNEKVTTRYDERGVATVTLANPDKHNAFDDTVVRQLTGAFDQVGASDARIMVLASEGKSFSSGADLDWMKRMAGYCFEDNCRDARALAEMLSTLNALPMPTIARVQGAAFGGAVGLACCCDMVVASETASFCLSEVKIGLIPATISPYVIEAIGARAARRYFTTAERFSAETAQQLGLVSQLCQAEQLDKTLQSLITTLLGNGPQATREAKRLVLDYANRAVDAELIADSSIRIARLRMSPEGQEGLGAFLEKRKPSWT